MFHQDGDEFEDGSSSTTAGGSLSSVMALLRPVHAVSWEADLVPGAACQRVSLTIFRRRQAGEGALLPQQTATGRDLVMCFFGCGWWARVWTSRRPLAPRLTFAASRISTCTDVAVTVDYGCRGGICTRLVGLLARGAKEVRFRPNFPCHPRPPRRSDPGAMAFRTLLPLRLSSFELCATCIRHPR